MAACSSSGSGPEHDAVHASAISGPTATTDAMAYQPGQSIVVSWTGTPGNLHDWVTLAPQGSDLTVSGAWFYTGGNVDGSQGFSGGLPGGTYVARLFADDTYSLITESAPFSVTSVSLSTDLSSYLPAQSIVVNYGNLPGNLHDWVAIAPQGALATTVTAYVYTAGATSGTATFAAPGEFGTYVARAFLDDSYAIAVESAPFTVDAGSVTLATDTSNYGYSQNVVVTWSGLSGSATDWIALAPPASPLTTITRWRYTGGGTSGSIAIESPGPGNFVARAFTSSSYTMAGETATFSVATPGGTTVTDLALYTTDQDIAVTWTGLQGVPGDWIALAPQGSPMTTISRWVYAGSVAAGTTTFVGGLPAVGTYVARTFSNNTYTLVQESASFDVQ